MEILEGRRKHASSGRSRRRKYLVLARRVGVTVEDRRDVEHTEADPERKIHALALLVHVEVVQAAIEDRAADGHSLVEEPGLAEGKIEKIRPVPALELEPQRVAAAEEVARRELELAEKAVQLRVSGSELHFVAIGVGAFDRDVHDLL